MFVGSQTRRSAGVECPACRAVSHRFEAVSPRFVPKSVPKSRGRTKHRRLSGRAASTHSGVVGESNMSTSLAVVPRVFAGLPLICEHSPDARAKPHIGRRAPDRAFADRVRRAAEHGIRDTGDSWPNRWQSLRCPAEATCFEPDNARVWVPGIGWIRRDLCGMKSRTP